MNNSPPAISLFRNRFVQAILLSGLFLQIGIWVRNYAILLFVMDTTGNNAFAVSMISVAEFAPIFLFSFIGGTFADRWRPKRTMIGCDLLSAFSVFAVLGAMMFATWKAVFLATLISSVLSQFSQPAGMRLFKLHVPEDQIQAGMSLYQTQFALFMVLGPVLGIYVYQQFGIEIAVGIMGMAFLLSAAVLTRLPHDPDQADGAPATSVWEEMACGFRYVRSSRVLSTLGGGFALAGLAIGLIQPLAVFLITERLGLPKEDLQWLMMGYGAGMIAGGAVAMALSKKLAPALMVSLGMFVDALMMSLAGWSTHLWLTVFTQIASGLMMPLIHIGINTMILQNTDAPFVGRVNGLLTPLFMGAMVLSMSQAGWLKGTFSLVALYQVSALLFVAGGALLLPLMKAGYGHPPKSEAQALSKPAGE